ncbi:MAG: CDP-alcohol phosphatidyltransferase family protein [Hyphomicrobiales bacterium]|nr:MAG: CDP-alcohol phosphatidyltransferase family protein [Hyphomicrobiales bacterium]
MFDAKVRPFINAPLTAAARTLAARGVTAEQVNFGGFVLGLGAGLAIAFGAYALGLVLIAANRIADGLDGAVARLKGPTDRGGFLDIVLDFVFYAIVPLAFAANDPKANALAAALLIAAFLANGAAFLAFAIIAAKRGLATVAQGEKSFFFLTGLAEGTETIIVFCLFCIWPAAFPVLATLFALVCLVSSAARVVTAYRALA